MTYHQGEKSDKEAPEKSFWVTPSGFVALIIIAILGYYLITAHGAHIVGYFAAFPWVLLVLLCPLMHLMHGGHGSHGRHDSHSGHPHHHHDEEKDSSDKKE